jgi:hypothetical protein
LNAQGVGFKNEIKEKWNNVWVRIFFYEKGRAVAVAVVGL